MDRSGLKCSTCDNRVFLTPSKYSKCIYREKLLLDYDMNIIAETGCASHSSIKQVIVGHNPLGEDWLFEEGGK